MELKKRENGVYYIIYGRGRKRSLKTRDTKEARARFNVEQRRVREGKITHLNRAQAIRLRDFHVEFMQHTDQRLALGEIRPATRRSYDLALRRLVDVIGDMPLRSITRTTINQFKQKMLDMRTSARAINVYLASLSVAFNYALTEEKDSGKHAYITDNPIERGKYGKGAKFRIDKSMPKFLDLDEIGAISRAIEDEAEAIRTEMGGAPSIMRGKLASKLTRVRMFRHIFALAINTGLRVGEIARLNWKDVSLSEGVILIGEWSKSRRGRIVPMNEGAMEALKEYGVKDLGPVFPVSGEYISKTFRRIARRAGVSEDKTMHSTRHTFGSWAAMRGVSLVDIQSFMGHSDPSTTKIYVDATQEHRKKEIKKLSFKLG